jgi:hypothetical protein
VRHDTSDQKFQFAEKISRKTIRRTRVCNNAELLREHTVMPQLFSRRADTTLRLTIGLIVALFVLAVVFGRMYQGSNYVTGQNIVVTQPVPFSHQHHVGALGLDCRNCHTSVTKSAFAGFPPTETCMTCHSQLWTNAQMLAPVRASLAGGDPLRWQKVNKLPGYVYFDHSIHLAKGVGCSTCHGAVQTMPLMRQAEPLTMGWCLDCHRHPERYVRPRTELFDMNWSAPDDQLERGRKLLVQYHVETEHLTDCSKCHR